MDISTINEKQYLNHKKRLIYLDTFNSILNEICIKYDLKLIIKKSIHKNEYEEVLLMMTYKFVYIPYNPMSTRKDYYVRSLIFSDIHNLDTNIAYMEAIDVTNDFLVETLTFLEGINDVEEMKVIIENHIELIKTSEKYA